VLKKAQVDAARERMEEGRKFHQQAKKLENVYEIATDPVERKKQLEAESKEMVAMWLSLYDE
jgi:hypothetical protein